MKIHRVKEKESVYSIAKEYMSFKERIIEDNGVLRPDALRVGRELLISTPTRTYTVREGDTVKMICRRFLISENELIRKNPSILKNGLYRGQILSLKCDTPPYSTAFSLGYFYKGTRIEDLSLALFYLSYIAVAAARVEGDDVRLTFDDTEAVKRTLNSGKIPLLRLYSDTGDALLTKTHIDTAILLLKSHGYQGLCLAVSGISDFEGYSRFLHDLKATLIEYGLMLFVELDKNIEGEICDYYDGAILSYSKLHLKNPPSFEDGEYKIFSDFANKSESSKGFIDLTPTAFFGGRFIDYRELLPLFENGDGEIYYDEKTKLSSLDLPACGRARGDGETIIFESLENLKAKLSLIDELGFMGGAFDIARTPVSYFLTLDYCFRSGGALNLY